MLNASMPISAPYLHLEGDIPTDLAAGAFLSLKRKQPLKIYSLGFQPAKTIPEIPRWFFRKYLPAPSAVVLDPFSGSGTTLLEAILHGHKASWVDYHPLSRLICRVKTTAFSPIRVLEASINM